MLLKSMLQILCTFRFCFGVFFVAYLPHKGVMVSASKIASLNISKVMKIFNDFTINILWQVTEAELFHSWISISSGRYLGFCYVIWDLRGQDRKSSTFYISKTTSIFKCFKKLKLVRIIFLTLCTFHYLGFLVYDPIRELKGHLKISGNW